MRTVGFIAQLSERMLEDHIADERAPGGRAFGERTPDGFAQG